uniref:Uncharacterized protein n=1 Tax=Micrurus lemniscatus lemniscatus TaxID=129467 RepID=A0A2D4HPX0_MICLE
MTSNIPMLDDIAYYVLLIKINIVYLVFKNCKAAHLTAIKSQTHTHKIKTTILCFGHPSGMPPINNLQAPMSLYLNAWRKSQFFLDIQKTKVGACWITRKDDPLPVDLGSLWKSLVGFNLK